jgi:hypothetical protein
MNIKQEEIKAMILQFPVEEIKAHQIKTLLIEIFGKTRVR